MIKTILLDMDGVCADFIGAVAKLYERPDLCSMKQCDVTAELGLTEQELWHEIESTMPDIFYHLEALPHFDELHAICTQYADVYFCSRPSWIPRSAGDKLAWIQQRFGRTYDHYIFTWHKHLLANPETLLIDDSVKNCDDFSRAGGHSSVYPAPWNYSGQMSTHNYLMNLDHFLSRNCAKGAVHSVLHQPPNIAYTTRHVDVDETVPPGYFGRPEVAAAGLRSQRQA